MARASNVSVISQVTLIPIGCVLATLAGSFGMSRYVTKFEVTTEQNIAAVNKDVDEIRENQKSNATHINVRLEESRRDMTELKSLEAATSAKVSMLIEHFGIDSRKRR